jgi:hypothetical protein
MTVRAGHFRPFLPATNLTKRALAGGRGLEFDGIYVRNVRLACEHASIISCDEFDLAIRGRRASGDHVDEIQKNAGGMKPSGNFSLSCDIK